MEKLTLYGLNKAGGFKIWTIETDEQGLITIQHGKEDGKLQTESTQCSGKNINRANETTPAQQAVSEAEGKIKKQKDKGYRETKLELSDIPLIAMLAVDYHKQGHRIKFPCLASVKYDGVRSLAKKAGGVVTLESRTGQLYDLPILADTLNEQMADGDVLDGEIYLHGVALQDIVSAVKRTDPAKAVEKAKRAYAKEVTDKIYNDLVEAELIAKIRPTLQFHLFDKPELDIPFETRLDWLNKYYDERFVENALIQKTEYIWIENEEDLLRVHRDAVERGFEGLMLRNLSGKYESGKRSADLQKYKEFLDSEFEIVDIVPDKDGGAIFVVKNIFADNTFQVVLGTQNWRLEVMANKEEYLNKMLTVKYQTLYKGTLKPQFPVGVVIRDYE